MLHVEETYKERGETLFEHTCTASCVFTCVSTCMCTTLHIIIICLLLNATRQKSNKADDKKKKMMGWHQCPLLSAKSACPVSTPPPPPPPLSLTPSMQLQSAIRLHIWLAATHTLQGQVVKGRVKGTYPPPVQHLSANALKTSDSTLRDPKIRYRGGQSDNFRSWSILKASATYFSGKLSRLQYLISSYLFFQTSHNLTDSVLHDQINRLM